MDRLPNEILINILRYLNTYDLMQFCEVFKNLDYFLREKNVTSISNWSRRYEIHSMNLCKFVSTKMNPCNLKVLNINSLYWIPAQDLRQLLHKLVNLEELYAVDTKLELKSKDIVQYSRLKKLAVSVADNHLNIETATSARTLTSLKALHIKIILKKGDHGEVMSALRVFFRNVSQLEELWVQDDQQFSYRLEYEQMPFELKNLKKFVVRSISVLPLYDFRYMGFTTVFECKRCNTEGELIFERKLDTKPATPKSIFDPKETELEKAWDVYLSLHATLPCGPKECKLITLKEDINDIQFEDMNFCDTVIFCNAKYVKAALQVLRSKNCSNLKRLSFRSCLFQNFQGSSKQKDETEEPPVSFKKPRIGVKNELLTNPFETVSRHLKNLVELEIYACQACGNGAVMSAYHLIENFVKLQKLTLVIPYLLNGSFIKQVFTSCRRLESLDLKLTAPNENFMMNLCQNLQHATSLKDIRLEFHNLTIEKLLKSLCEIPSKKLVRLFIKCQQICYTKNGDIKEICSTFLEQNPQLVFFLLVSNYLSKKEISDIQKILHTYSEGDPAKVFYVKKDICPHSGIFPIPAAHCDIMFNRTNVSVIHFDEF